VAGVSFRLLNHLSVQAWRADWVATVVVVEIAALAVAQGWLVLLASRHAVVQSALEAG
jgi:hypothetical protein